MTFTEKVKSKLSNILDYEKVSENLTEQLKHLSAETIGWLAAILVHLATIPTLMAVLTGLTEKMPPVDLVLFSWGGLFLLFVKATIQKDLLNIVTIGFGFFIQAAIMALIIFK
jgi:hypothetical protein